MNESPIADGAGPRPTTRRAGAARTVATGILLSRLAGFVRDASLAFFFGAGPHADVFRAALRGPNLLQNLLGEQTLSASFIPIYSRMIGEGREAEAGRFAGAIFGLLVAVAGGLSLVGVLLAEPIVAVLSSGYLADAGRVAAGEMTVDRFPLAVAAVRWMFPMTGLLVLSAWSLGVLNSHRRFFLPYFAPVLWNAAIVAAVWGMAASILGEAAAPGAALPPAALDRLLIAACVGGLVGGALQFLVQLPLVARVIRGFRPSFSLRAPGVRQALGAFTPLLAGRGAVQLSGYLDLWLSSFLAAGAQAALGWAQTVYLLPVALFGMSVAAAELPELARRTGDADREETESRLSGAWRQMAFLTVPTAVGFLAFGFLIVGGLFRRGRFGVADNWLVYLVLAAYTLGLLATNSSRLLNNLFFARGKTRVPARVAMERVALSAILGVGLMLWLDRVAIDGLPGVAAGERRLYLGAVGLALGAAVSSWYELWRLRRSVRREMGELSLSSRPAAAMLALALVSALPAIGLWHLLPPLPVLLTAILVVGLYASAYLGLSLALGGAEIRTWLRRSGRDSGG